MNKIAVATHLNGSQSLHALHEIYKLGQGKDEQKQMQTLANWCYCRKIKNLEIRNMDGTLDGWILKMN